MRLRIRETGAVVYDDEFRRMYPDTSFPAVLSVDLLNDFGADPVLEGPQPTLTENQYSRYDGAEQVEGTWFTVYTAVDYTEEEIAARLEQWRQSTSCTPFQGRMALSDASLLTNAEAAVNAADDKTKTAWEYALIWQRSSPMISALGAALGMTDVQIDDLFKAAQKIKA